MRCCSCCARSACSASSATRARPSCRCSSTSRPTSNTCSACRNRSWSAWPTATRTATQQRRLRQPALGGRRRPRDGRDLHRVEEPHAARHHRRPAGAIAVPVRPVPVLGAGDRAAQALRQVELRAGPCRRRAAGDRPRLLPRDAAAARPGAGLDPVRRLGPRLRAGRAARASASRRAATPPCSPRSAPRSTRASGPRSSSVPASTAAAPGTRSVPLAERHRARVFTAPMSARCGFAEDHPQFAGFLPAMRERIVAALAGSDLVLVLGAPAFTYHVEGHGPHVPAGAALCQITDDAETAARAPVGTRRRGRPARRGADAAATAGAARRGRVPAGRPARPRAEALGADVGGLCVADPGGRSRSRTTSSSKKRRARAR